MKPTSLIIGFVLAFIFLSCLCYLVWINRGGENVIAVFAKSVLAPILVAAGLLLYDLFSDTPHDKIIFPCCLISSSQDPIHTVIDLSLIGKNPDPLYEFGTHSAFDTLWYWSGKKMGQGQEPDPIDALTPQQQEAIQKGDEFYLDLLDCAIWRWLSFRYGGNWDDEKILHFQGFSAGVGIDFPAENYETNVYELDDSEIKALFGGNLVVSTWLQDSPVSATEALDSPALPIDCKVKITGKSGQRNICIDTKEITINITVTSEGYESGPLPKSGLGGKIRESFAADDFMLREYIIKTEWSVKPLTKWSPRALSQRRWAEDLMASLNDNFNWQNVQQQLGDK
jgi:hypothetical protein